MQPSYNKQETHQNQYIKDSSSSILTTNETQIKEFMTQPKSQQLFSLQNHHFSPFYPKEKGEENHATASFGSSLRPSSFDMQPHYEDVQEDPTFKQPPYWKLSYTELLNSCHKGYIEGEEEKEFLKNNHTMQNGAYFEEVLAKTNETKNLENTCSPFDDLKPIYERSYLPLNDHDFRHLNSGMGSFSRTNVKFDHQSEAEEASFSEVPKRKKRKKMEGKMGSVTDSLERLTNQIIDHQAGLHKKFLETIERLDQERKEREEAWRSRQLAMYQQEAITRAHEQALASRREATIVSCLEKITGQTINISPRTTPYYSTKD